MFKFILTLAATLSIFASPATTMAQEVYSSVDHTITFWDQWNEVWIDASASQNGAAIEIDFDWNKIEIEVNGEDYDLPIGQNEGMTIFVIGSNADDVLYIHGNPSDATVQAFMQAGDDQVECSGNAQLIAYGDDGDDLLIGGSNGDYLIGGAGFDILLANDGADYLEGGLDGCQDWLEGGADHDLFIQYMHPKLKPATISPRTVFNPEIFGRAERVPFGVKEAENRVDFNPVEDVVYNFYPYYNN